MKKVAGSGNKITHVHVIGAGAMGGDIAAWCANQGLKATLADMKPEPIAGAVKRAADLFGKIIRKRTEVRDALDRLVPDLDGEGVRTADLVIEAVPEKLELKQKVYAGLEPRMKPGAIAFTRIPFGAQSIASAFVSCPTPPLDAVYAAVPGRVAAVISEAMLMIFPRFSSAISRLANAWLIANNAETLIAITSCQSSSDNVSAGPRRVMPAELTRMSGTPCSATTRSYHSGICAY